VSAEMIDKIGILEATNEAMRQALAMLSETMTPTHLLVDGRDAFWFEVPHTSIIKGDDKEACIAAGSIIAKVTRDRWMVDVAREFPVYGFEGHKGYGSSDHIAAIQKHGPCEIHRRSFLTRILNPETSIASSSKKTSTLQSPESVVSAIVLL
jgi:ribonuclease HII